MADIIALGTLAAAVATAIVAIAGLFVAMRQIRSSREVEALNAYEKYHHLCLEYPEFGTGDFDWASAEPVERRRYFVFVLSVLLTIERILVLFPRDRVWRAAFLDDLDCHERFLRSDEFVMYQPAIDKAVLRLVEESRRRQDLRRSVSVQS